MSKPECSSWKVWTGLEIEGDKDIGKETLFIRDIALNAEDVTTDLVAKMTRHGKISRLWFCKEFRNWELIAELSKYFETTCIEATIGTYNNIPKKLRQICTIYLKVDLPLKKGDFVCIGQAFSDEAFRIGTGKTVCPSQYAKDKKIL